MSLARCTTADAVIRVYDAGGDVIETLEHAGEFKELWEQPAICR
jgi:hypothetical protein